MDTQSFEYTSTHCVSGAQNGIEQRHGRVLHRTTSGLRVTQKNVTVSYYMEQHHGLVLRKTTSRSRVTRYITVSSYTEQRRGRVLHGTTSQSRVKQRQF